MSRRSVRFTLPSRRSICPALASRRSIRSRFASARRLVAAFVALLLLHQQAAPAPAQTGNRAAADLVGLWEARRRFGPDVRGTLLVAREPRGGWRAEIAGRAAEVEVAGNEIRFDLAGGEGAFRGHFEGRRARIAGHWIQPRTVANGTPYASPVTLARQIDGSWRGDVAPLDDAMTFYLKVAVREDGSVGAFLRNPERNVGRFLRVDAVEREGDAVRLLSAASKDRPARVLARGVVREDGLTLDLSGRGDTYDFRRVGPDEPSDFYPRGRPSVEYVYRAPIRAADNWLIGTPEQVGMSREALRRFVQTIVDEPMDSLGAPQVHGLLVARHGRLVLEEYFHGEHRDKPHDTRSAAKSLTSTLVGAAIHAGAPLDVTTPVYRAMNGGAFAPGLEPRKRALTLEHLLTMSSGFDCDDDDPNSPGAEDVIGDSENPDWYKTTLGLGMIRDPGEKAVYCSINPNLAGGVLARSTKRELPDLLRELVAAPLGIDRYYMNMTPTGEAFMGGGVRFLPRDFMKLGQLYLNGGTWNGRRVLASDWCRRATSPLYELRGLRYGYLWWVIDYPYRGRSVRAFFAGGNGGQLVMVVPDLDLVVATYGGSYSDPAGRVIQQKYVPEYVLPAIVDDGGKGAGGNRRSRPRRS